MSDKLEFYTPEVGSIPQISTAKLLHMIFVVDVSGSMKKDGRIDAVNDAFEEMIPELKNIQNKCQSEFELKISILSFDKEARWLVEPTPILEYNHKAIDCNNSLTKYGAAFNALRIMLSRDEAMAHTGKIAIPYIMFLTDGEPKDDYYYDLNELLNNDWFNSSMRFAVLIGSEAMYSDKAKTAVSRFVKNTDEGIINADDAVTLAKEVQARTLKTINIVTLHHLNQSENDKEIFENQINN